MNGYEIVSLCLSGGAILISLISMRWTHKISKEQLELERITAELSTRQLQALEDELKNKTTPKFQVTISKFGKDDFFYIVNIGEATAHDVNFEIIDCNYNPLISDDFHEKFPCPEMKSQSKIKLFAAFGLGSPSRYQVKISWENTSGDSQNEIFWVTR